MKTSLTSVKVDQIILDFLAFNYDAWTKSQDLIDFDFVNIDGLIHWFLASLTNQGVPSWSYSIVAVVIYESSFRL